MMCVLLFFICGQCGSGWPLRLVLGRDKMPPRYPDHALWKSTSPGMVGTDTGIWHASFGFPQPSSVGFGKQIDRPPSPSYAASALLPSAGHRCRLGEGS